MARTTKKARPNGRNARGTRAKKKHEAAAKDRKERPEMRVQGRDALSHYFRDLRTARKLLTPEDELALGEQVQGALAATRKNLQELLESDLLLLEGKVRPKGKKEARKERFARAQSRRRRFNPDDLTGPELELHIAEMTSSEDGLPFIKEFGSPGGAEAADRLITANLRLVISIAGRYRRSGMRLDELIQEGNLGLIVGALKYDYRRGYRFSTYATWWIRHAISRAIADRGREIRIPVHMIEFIQQVERIRDRLSKKLARDPREEEIACEMLAGQRSKNASAEKEPPSDKVLEFLTRKIQKAIVQGFLPISMSRPLGHESGDEFGDMISAEEPERDPHWAVFMGAPLQEAFADLSPIQADVLRKRVGLGGNKVLTFREIGEQYHLSRERIRQIQNEAIGALRKALEKTQSA